MKSRWDGEQRRSPQRDPGLSQVGIAAWGSEYLDENAAASRIQHEMDRVEHDRVVWSNQDASTQPFEDFSYKPNFDLAHTQYRSSNLYNDYGPRSGQSMGTHPTRQNLYISASATPYLSPPQTSTGLPLHLYNDNVQTSPVPQYPHFAAMPSSSSIYTPSQNVFTLPNHQHQPFQVEHSFSSLDATPTYYPVRPTIDTHTIQTRDPTTMTESPSTMYLSPAESAGLYPSSPFTRSTSHESIFSSYLDPTPPTPHQNSIHSSSTTISQPAFQHFHMDSFRQSPSGGPNFFLPNSNERASRPNTSSSSSGTDHNPHTDLGTLQTSFAISSRSGARRRRLQPSPPLAPSPSRSGSSSSRSDSSSAPFRPSISSSTKFSRPQRGKISRSMSSPSVPKASTLKTGSGSGSGSGSGARQTVETECSCVQCGKRLAKAILRGVEKAFERPYTFHYRCRECERARVQAQDDEIGMNQLPPIPSGMITDMSGTALNCHVCSRTLGSGELRLLPLTDATGNTAEAPHKFTVEIICHPCDARYQRCTDCGGGGGPRLGIGKFRARQVFDQGRRTCRFSHLRTGSISDMSYDTWLMDSLPTTTLTSLSSLTQSLFIETNLRILATPEEMEVKGSEDVHAADDPGLSKSYEEVERGVYESWNLIENFFKEKTRTSPNIRRYIALRWSVPKSRKRTRPTRSDTISSNPGSQTMMTPDSLSMMLRPDKTLVGVILAELDMSTGSVFTPLILPAGSGGDSYHITSNFLKHLHQNLERDSRGLIIESNMSGYRMQIKRGLRVTWTMTMLDKETRVLSRRGYYPLDEFLKRNPSASEEDFPPYKAVFFPLAPNLKWAVWAKRVSNEEDDWGDGKLSI